MTPNAPAPAPTPTRILRRQFLSLLGGTWLAALLLIIAGILAFTFRVEQATWQTRQDEAARATAITVAKAIQRVDDLQFVIGLVGLDEAAEDEAPLQSLLKYNPALLELVVLDENGRLIGSAHQTSAVLANLFTIPQSRWYQTARNGRHFVSPLQFSARDEPYLILALPAPGGHVIAARVSMQVIQQSVTEIRFGATGRAYIVDAAGRVIAHTDSQIVLAQTYIADRPEFQALTQASDRRWSGSYTSFDGVPVVGATAPVPNTDWVVVMELTQVEAFANSWAALLWLGLGVAVIGLLLQSFMATRLRRLVFEPLEELRAGVEHFGEENLDYRLNLHRRDELGELAQSFNSMAERLQTREAQITAQAQALREEVGKRQTAEAEALLQRDFAVQVMNSMGQGLAVLDADFNFGYVNPAGAAMLGYQPEQLLGQSPLKLVFAEDRDRFLRLMTRWRKGEATTYDVRIRRADGQALSVLATVTPRSHNGRFVGAIGVITDLTERNRSELALRESEERYRRLAGDLQQLNAELEDRVRERTGELEQALADAREANRLKQEFLANTSHELRTPLSGIMGALNLILEDTCESPEEEREFLRVAYQASRHLLAIVTDILDTAKMEAGHWIVHLQPLVLSPLLTEVARLVQPQVEARQIDLKIAPAPETELLVLADLDGLRRILLNLVSNAVKFTEQGSVTLSVTQNGAQAQISVTDTGIGITPGQLDRLFQPFVQADGSTTRKYGGTGLGLSISRLLAEAMGGTIVVHSAGANQGATFTVSLPLAAPAQPVELAPRQEVTA